MQTTCSLSLTLYFYDLLSKFANSLDPEDRPTCLIREKQAYQELFASDDHGTFQTSTYFQMHAMGGSREGWIGGPDPPPPPMKHHKNIGFPSNDPDTLKLTKLPSQHSVVTIDMPAKRHFKGVSLIGRWWSILVAFWSSLTTPSDKMFWIRACMQCVCTGSIEMDDLTLK